MRSIMLCEKPQTAHRVYAEKTLQSLYETAQLDKKCYRKADIEEAPAAFHDVQCIFSTWGMPVFTQEEIGAFFPNLKAVFYGAGTVQAFAAPFLQRGIKVFSAWAANGVPVAEYTVAQIILANKGFFQTAARMSVGQVENARQVGSHYPGSYGCSVGIIGAGMIGKQVISLLKNYMLDVKVFDPFLPEEKAEAMGVKKCSLEELFSTCQVVSNHLANNPQTVGMLTGRLFSSMLPYAAFLNTGRGAQVVEEELAKVLSERPDLTAVLDVTFPEPPCEGHPFYQLPNCILTPHIAGSLGDEVHRMAEYMQKEFDRWIAGEACLYEVNLQMLKTMA